MLWFDFARLWAYETIWIVSFLIFDVNVNHLMFSYLILQSFLSHCVSFNVVNTDIGNDSFEVSFASLSHLSLKLIELFLFLGFFLTMIYILNELESCYWLCRFPVRCCKWKVLIYVLNVSFSLDNSREYNYLYILLLCWLQ